MNPISFYYLHRSGTAEKKRYSLSLLKDNVSLAIKDDTSRVIWVFHGKNTHSETLRLFSYSIAEVNEGYNYKITVLDPEDFDLYYPLLIKIYKDPENKVYVDELTALSGHSYARQKKNKKQDTASKYEAVKYASVPKEKQNYKQKTQIKQEITQKKEVKQSFTSNQIGRVISSAPPSPHVPVIKSSTPSHYVLKGDETTGPMIEEFQIAYYEKTGGSNYILMEELPDDLTSDQFKSIQQFVQKISELKNSNADVSIAFSDLEILFQNLVSTVFES